MNDNGFYLLGHGRLWVRVLVWQGRGGLQGRGLYRSRDLHWGPGVSGCWFVWDVEVVSKALQLYSTFVIPAPPPNSVQSCIVSDVRVRQRNSDGPRLYTTRNAFHCTLNRLCCQTAALRTTRPRYRSRTHMPPCASHHCLDDTRANDCCRQLHSDTHATLKCDEIAQLSRRSL